MSSHMFEEIEKTCDRTAIIRSGRIAAVEDMKSLAGKRKKVYRVTLGQKEAVEKLLAEPEVQIWSPSDFKGEMHSNQVDLTISGSLPGVLRKFADYGVQDLEVRTQSLEELFLQYYETDTL